MKKPTKQPSYQNLLGIPQRYGAVSMSPALKKLWINALLSGKYRQGRRTLCSINKYRHRKYCCLGVLCKILQDKGFPVTSEILTINNEKCYRFRYGEYENSGFIPRGLREVIGLSDKIQNDLQQTNDDTENPKSFKDIAEIIKKTNILFN